MGSALKRFSSLIVFALWVGCAAGWLHAQGLLLLGVGPTAFAAVSDLSAGDIVIRLSGNCGAGFTEVSGLNGMFLRGTVAANADQGTTGGADSVTPTFTGTADSLTHSGTAVTDHASHTHSYSDVLNHTHVVNVTDPTHNHTQNAHTHVVTSQTATTGSATSYEHGTLDTSSAEAEVTEVTGSTTATNIAAATGITATTNNPAGGVASGTTAGPSATLTHSVTQPSAHSYTPTGTISAIDNKPALTRVIFCEKS